MTRRRNVEFQWRPFRVARARVQTLGLKCVQEWLDYCHRKKLPGIPIYPDVAYRDRGWKSWGDWLGTGTVAVFRRVYRSHRRARAFARKLNLKSIAHWGKYIRGCLPGRPPLPRDIPADPAHYYKKGGGWIGWGDFLGTGNVAPSMRNFRPFFAARKFARGLGLRNREEWKAYARGRIPSRSRLPKDIPLEPPAVYRNQGWAGWGDWLGTGYVVPWLRQYRSFADARKFVRSLQLQGWNEWLAYKSGRMPWKPPLPADIPRDPRHLYLHEGWKGIADWVGNERPRRSYVSGFKRKR